MTDSSPLGIRTLGLLADNVNLRLFLCYEFLTVLGCIIPYVVLPSVGAKFFSSTSTSDCSYDFADFAWYDGIFSACGGVLGYTFGGVIGRWSDNTGRKPILLLNIVMYFSCYIALTFTDNIWMYFGLYLMYGIFASHGVWQAYIADVVEDKQLPLAYGLACMVAAVTVIIGAVAGWAIDYYFGYHTNFLVSSALGIVVFFFVMFILPESLQEHNRRHTFHISQCINPLVPLFKLCSNSTLLCLTAISLLLALPGLGLNTVLVAYMNATSCIASTSQSASLITVLFVSLGIGMLVVHGLVLPRLLEYTNWNYWTILVIGNISFMIMLLIVCFFYYFPTLYIAAIIGLLDACGSLVIPAIMSLVSLSLSPTEQGVGMGSVMSWTLISTKIVGPLGLTALYAKYQYTQPTLPFVITAVVTGLALMIVWWPLDNALKAQSSTLADISLKPLVNTVTATTTTTASSSSSQGETLHHPQNQFKSFILFE